ncbi:MAG: CopD family protein [Candidatus Binatia bacterium]
MTDFAAVVRFVHLAAAVLLAGSFSFAVLIARPAMLDATGSGASDYEAFIRVLQRLGRYCLLVIFLSALLGLWIQTVNVSEDSAGAAFNFAAILSLTTETQYGRVWLARMFIALLLAVFFIAQSRKRRAAVSFSALFIGAVLGTSLLTSLAFAGHASAADGSAFFLQVSFDALHLLAAGFWLGGLPSLGLLLRQCQRNGAAELHASAQIATRRFSALALASVALLILSGSYNAWNLVGGFAPLFGTAYGKLLLLKLALLLPLLALGALNLLRLKPRIVGTSSNRLEEMTAALRALSRNVIVETGFGLAILLVVGYMGVTAPARHVQPDWPFSFRWDWTVLEKAPKARAEFDHALIWAVIGITALVGAIVRRRRRGVLALIAVGALGYAIHSADTIVSIDAYPATYKRPAVTYQSISVANGSALYQDSGCIACHGPSGYGDGPSAQDLNPKPVDLNAPHANAHTAGDLFWWLSHGVKPSSAMPGFGASLSEEERWDLINFMRALSSGESARNLAPVIEDTPWLVAPDFTYGTNTGESRTLRDHRGQKVVLLVLLNVEDTEERLQQLSGALPQLKAAGIEVIVVPNLIDYFFVADKLPGLVVNEGIREIAETYTLFARSFIDENLLTSTPHVEFLIDKQGYIRARWLPSEGDAWRDFTALLSQVALLQKEKPRAPAPDEHVH